MDRSRLPIACVSLGNREHLVLMFEEDKKNKKEHLLDRPEAGTSQLKIFPQTLGVALPTMTSALSRSPPIPLTKRSCHRKLPFPCVLVCLLQCSIAGHLQKFWPNYQDRCAVKLLFLPPYNEKSSCQ